MELEPCQYSEKNFNTAIVFIRRGSTIKCIVNGNQWYLADLIQGAWKYHAFLLLLLGKYMLFILLPVLLFIRLTVLVVCRSTMWNQNFYLYCLWLSLWCLSNCCKNEEIGVSKIAVSLSKPPFVTYIWCFVHNHTCKTWPVPYWQYIDMVVHEQSITDLYCSTSFHFIYF